MIIVEAAKNPIKVKDVFKNIEEKYNVKIPESIKSFMIKHSGEKPKTNNIKLGDKPYEEFNIRIFSSVNPNDKYYFFGNFVDWFFENGKKVIPIAETDGGDYFVIDITNGKVYYWYHDAAEDYYPIANSLNEFYKLTQMKEN